MATIGLGFQLSANAARMSGGVNEAVKQLGKISEAAEKTAKDVSALKTIAIGSVFAKGIGMASAAFTSAANSAMSYVASVSSSVDAMNDLAERTGIGVESLQALQMAAKLSGVEDVTAAVQKLGVAIGKAAESGNTGGFTRLGIEFASLQQMSPERQFIAVQNAIASLPTPAAKAAAAVEIFGKSGVELLPLMNKNIAQMEVQMRKLGIIVGTEQVKAIGDMNDALDIARATFAGITAQVTASLAPVVTGLVSDMLRFVQSFKSVNGSGGQGIANTIADGLLRFADVLARIFDYGVDNFKGIAARLESVYKTADNIAQYIPFARAVLGTFGGAGGSSGSSPTGGAAALVAAARETFFSRRAGAAQQGTEVPFYVMQDQERERANAEAARKRSAAGAAAMNDFRKAAEEAAAARREAAAKKQKESAERRAKAAEDAAKIGEDIDAKKAEGRAILSERASALRGKSNESLKANDIRSSEGMAQFIALATGREDPAIEEYRKQTKKLDEIRAELRALQLEQVTILNGAGA